MRSRFDIVVGGKPPEAEADGSIALSRGEAQGAEHVRWLRYAGRTGGAGGCGEPRLQPTKNILRVEAVKSDIGVARMAAIANGAVDGNGRMPVLQVPNE